MIPRLTLCVLCQISGYVQIYLFHSVGEQKVISFQHGNLQIVE